ncbi:MAG: PAS domain-containing protein [Proteobacteria bacterium]|nr:PAS domain-containing protein [Pseudomonadota bacterium]
MKNHMVLSLFAILAIFTTIMALLGREIQKIGRKNEQQLKFQQTLIDTIPSPVFCKDTAFRYTGCNKAFESYIGYSKDELLGKTADELWPKELADHYLQQDRLLFENPGLQCYEGATRFADGTVRDVIFNKATFDDNTGSVQGLVGVMLDITDRKRAEEAVAFQNILLSTQQEASIDGILVVNENAEILSINRRFIEIMGIPAHLLEEKEDEPVLAYVTTLMADPRQFQEKVRYLYEHRLEFSRDELSLCDGKTLDRYTVPLLSPDGRYYGRLWSFRDITERKAAEEETKNTCQELLDIIEFLPDATFVVDKDKRVIAWNRAIEKMTGLNKEAVMGKGNNVYSTPFYGEPRPILIDLVDEALDVISGDYPAITREGRTLFTEAFVPSFRTGDNRFFWATASPLLDTHGKMVGAIESIRDITEYKRAGEEKLRLESQLSHTQIMETLLVRLGHDLKTPLTPLLMLLPLIKNRISDPETKKMVDMCSENINCIKALAEKNKMFVSLVSSIKPYEYQNVTLVSAVEECLAESVDTIATKGLSCQVSIEPSIVVPAVPEQLKELLCNLISNAVRYSPKQGVIYITAYLHAETVSVSVRDEGVGLTMDHLEHIFDEFYKADESRHERGTSGLGLSICKRIVRNHHGRIWAESAGLGQGTTIVFTLHQHSNAMQHSEKETVTNG